MGVREGEWKGASGKGERVGEWEGGGGRERGRVGGNGGKEGQTKREGGGEERGKEGGRMEKEREETFNLCCLQCAAGF